jgi:hypothetical protein
MESIIRNKHVYAIIVIELVVIAFLCSVYFPYTPDDGYIYLYGARQLAGGAVPNYTPGENPTNAFGSPVWMALLSLAYVFSISPVVWGKILGMALLLGSAVIIARILLLLAAFEDKLLAHAAALTAATLPFAAACAVNLLDTMLATFALLLALYATLRSIREDKGWLGTGLAMGLLIVSRPDAFLGVLILAAGIGVSARRRKPSPRSIIRLIAGLVPGLIVYALNAYAFGEILPNSAAAKTPGLADLLSLDIYKRAAYVFLVDFARDPVLFIVYLALVPFCIFVKDRVQASVFVALSLIYLAVFVLVRDWMGIHRLYLPSIMAAYTAFLYVLAVLPGGKEKIVVALTLMIFAFPMGRSHWKYYLGYNYNFPGSPAEQMGRFIAEHKLPDSYLLTCDMGVVPYYAGIPTIDSNDAPICNSWLRNHPDDLDYVFRHEMDFIILVNHREDGRAGPVFSMNEKIARSGYFRENYHKIAVATWRPTIEQYKERGFSIGYGRYFHLFVSKRIWDRLPDKRPVKFPPARLFR